MIIIAGPCAAESIEHAHFSDGPNMVKLNDLSNIIYHIMEINNVCR